MFRFFSFCLFLTFVFQAKAQVELSADSSTIYIRPRFEDNSKIKYKVERRIEFTDDKDGAVDTEDRKFLLELKIKNATSDYFFFNAKATGFSIITEDKLCFEQFFEGVTVQLKYVVSKQTIELVNPEQVLTKVYGKIDKYQQQLERGGTKKHELARLNQEYDLEEILESFYNDIRYLWSPLEVQLSYNQFNIVVAKDEPNVFGNPINTLEQAGVFDLDNGYWFKSQNQFLESDSIVQLDEIAVENLQDTGDKLGKRIGFEFGKNKESSQKYYRNIDAFINGKKLVPDTFHVEEKSLINEHKVTFNVSFVRFY